MWADGKLTEANIKSLAGRPVKIRSATPLNVAGDVDVKMSAGPSGTVISFPTEAGKSYRVQA
jgi:hypothetical protein